MPTIVSNADLAWMAGVIDLRGKMNKKKNPQRAAGTRQIVLYVESQELAIIKRLSELTGIRPMVRTMAALKDFDRKGCAQHCPDKHIHVDRSDYALPTIGRWTVTGSTAAVILYNLLPYLITDRGMTDMLHTLLLQVPKNGKGRTAVDTALRRMQKLGWTIPDYLLPESDPRHKTYDPFEGSVEPED